jgi:predicted patatin/cPLA2 family phospholipase
MVPSGVIDVWLLLSLTIMMVGSTAGCGTVPTRTPLPQELSERAVIPGIPKARFWGDEAPPWTHEWWALSPEEVKAQYPEIYGKEHSYLALSGGGANGAFGAGLLLGWTDSGTRPEFTMVTGISTGALIAPFAFLGSAYDGQLKEIFTGVSTEDILTPRQLLTGLTSDALADSTPLQNLISKYVTPQMMEALASEYRKGRELYIGTTNLDAARPVIWNLTRIAASGHPKSLELIHKLLLASASIPVAFPPVLIEVEANGQRYDELHVDGGGASQIFLYPLGIDWRRVKKTLNVQGTPKAYLIRNGQFKEPYQIVEPSVTSIAGHSINSLLASQGIGDMYRVYFATKRDGLSYHLAYIPEVFTEQPKEPFDTEHMCKLFDLAYKSAKEGYPWLKYPPGAEIE